MTRFYKLWKMIFAHSFIFLHTRVRRKRVMSRVKIVVASEVSRVMNGGSVPHYMFT